MSPIPILATQNIILILRVSSFGPTTCLFPREMIFTISMFTQKYKTQFDWTRRATARKKMRKFYIQSFVSFSNLVIWCKTIIYIWSMNHGLPLFVRRFVNISQPVSVTKSVCSNCADHSPSFVTAVQLSGHCSSRQLPDKYRDIVNWCHWQ